MVFRQLIFSWLILSTWTDEVVGWHDQIIADDPHFPNAIKHWKHVKFHSHKTSSPPQPCHPCLWLKSYFIKGSATVIRSHSEESPDARGRYTYEPTVNSQWEKKNSWAEKELTSRKRTRKQKKRTREQTKELVSKTRNSQADKRTCELENRTCE